MALLYRMGTGNGSGGDIKPYTVNFECANGYIGQTLTMTYQGTPHAGEVVDNVSGTVGSDGTLTLYPMHSGIWECSCYSSVTGKTMTKAIDLSYWGIQPTVAFEDAPEGATVTPIDDVQTWLHCANIWDKSYTRVDEVITDTTSLNTLIANENANDYLVRSTTFATDMCADETAMTYIGLNNYCANKLLANSTWLEAICNSTYFEKVLNVKVPTMTSNTTPSGEVIFSDYDTGSVNYPYKAFNGNINDFWNSDINAGNTSYIGYKFTKPVLVGVFNIDTSPVKNSDAYRDFKFIIQAYNGESWDDITTEKILPISNPVLRFAINNDKYYEQYRLKVTHYNCIYMGLKFTALHELQFYGRAKS